MMVGLERARIQCTKKLSIDIKFLFKRDVISNMRIHNNVRWILLFDSSVFTSLFFFSRFFCLSFSFRFVIVFVSPQKNFTKRHERSSYTKALHNNFYVSFGVILRGQRNLLVRPFDDVSLTDINNRV